MGTLILVIVALVVMGGVFALLLDLFTQDAVMTQAFKELRAEEEREDRELISETSALLRESEKRLEEETRQQTRAQAIELQQARRKARLRHQRRHLPLRA